MSKFVKIRMRLWLWLAMFAFTICATHAQADSADRNGISGIVWEKGPIQAALGGVANIAIPKGYAFTDGNGARRFLELNQNPPSGREIGLIMPIPSKGDPASTGWFVLFQFDEVGYVTDSDHLDSEAILDSIKRGTEKENVRRKANGWPAFHVTGWSTQPFYDSSTHNLTWAILGQADGDEGQAVNHSVRILGRRGAVSADLVLDANQVSSVLPRYNGLLSNLKFNPGNKYADFVKGDKVAGYGLTALIAGGAAAAAVKTGLFSKLWRLIIVFFAAIWKFMIFLFAGVAAVFRKLVARIKRLFSTRDDLIESERMRLRGEALASQRDDVK
jgi:uncharacterized membrane-anchored protein